METKALDTASSDKVLAEATLSRPITGELDVTRLEKEFDGDVASLLLSFVLTTQLPRLLRVAS